jgi:predicted nucleic acid-binding protein
MKVLVDICIWSLALPRQTRQLTSRDSLLKAELTELVKEGRVGMIGPIRRELLSGIRDQSQYRKLRDVLRAFPDEPIKTTDYEIAASLHNQRRIAHITGSAIAFVICAVAVGRRWQLFTSDGDFRHYAEAVPIPLSSLRAGSDSI